MNAVRDRLRRLVSEDRGETLIETVMSTALIGIVVVGLLGALATTIFGSKVHRQQADANTTLVAVMEHLKSPTAVPRVACANTTSGPNGYQDEAASVVPAGSGTVTYTIQYQTFDSTTGAVGWSGTCQETTGSTLTLQKIALTLTTDDGAVSPSLSFLKGEN